VNRILALILIVLFGMVNFAYAQSAKDTYKAVKKAELKASPYSSKAWDEAIVDARTEMDLLKGSDEAKKNPEFTKHIETALNNIRKASGLSYCMDQGLRSVSPDDWKKTMSQASIELEAAKRYLK
jgi:hypothetical protein